MPPDSIVLLSGGVDSVVLAESTRRAGRLIGCIHVVYPHPAQSQERRAVAAMGLRWWRAGHPQPFREVVLPLQAGELATGIGEPGARLVAARNLVLLAHAVNIAPTMGASRVLIGATLADSDGYPDCRPDYLAAVSVLAAPFGVSVEAPLSGASRSDVLVMAHEMGVDLGAAWSCYQPREGWPCGTCDSCRQGVTP